MIHRSVREWGYVPIDEFEDGSGLTRSAADQLIEVARSTPIGGEDGANILVNGARRLRAQQVVGIISTKEATLEILPKIDADDAATRRCLVHMLANVLDIEISVGDLTDLDFQQRDLLEILIRLFCETLFQAVHQGLPRGYSGCEADRPSLRGRLDIKRQFTTLAMTPQILACRFDEFTTDIALNQIMKAAVGKLTGLSISPDNQRRLWELAFAFAEVSLVPVARLPWSEVVLDRTNRSWHQLLRFARLLLAGDYQTTTSGHVRGFALLFEMNSLFEEYVGRALKRALAGSGFTVRLQGPRGYALIDEPSGKYSFATRPDIVVGLGGQPILIIDTKWKRLNGPIDEISRSVGQSEVYQMIAYSHVYRCDRMMLLYPHHSGLGVQSGKVSLHRFVGKENSRLHVATVPLLEPRSLHACLKSLVITDGSGR